ncbi:TPA: tetratricopeptide repeat protein [Vibrio diabolicus]|uniref:tetratricopeptide repeat protein n=1 Tax=Vibrio diabolicus TaxID=50719 RepID=UPI0022868E56|nr:hypothetical protein [Vibrio diabolicus]MCZ0757880.1 hypothetical protein [Vibrio diabolicus]
MEKNDNGFDVLTSVLENHFGWVTLLIIVIFALCLFRKPISNFISNAKVFSYKDFKLESEGGNEPKEPSSSKEESAKPIINEGAKLNEVENVENQDSEGVVEVSDDWWEKVTAALNGGDINKADLVFGNFCQQQKDVNKIYRERSLFLYLKFTDGNDMDALNQLELHTQNAINDELRANALSWLSSGLLIDKQHARAIKLWDDFISKSTNSKLVVEGYIDIATHHFANDEPLLAKDVLLKALKETSLNSQKSEIYIKLSKAEDKLGNKTVAAACLNQAVEYCPENTQELFDAAFYASECDISELAIVHYNLLTRRQPQNADAWNNLGVQAKKAGFNIKSIQSYKKAADLHESLALANQGYALLGVGFADDAEKLAQKALQMKKPHPNVHRLISDIESERKKENEKWAESLKYARKKQIYYQKYIEKYYLPSSEELIGTWLTGDGIEVQIQPNENKFDLKWTVYRDASQSKIEAKCSLNGEVQGSTFEGRYNKTHPDKYSSFLVPKDISFICCGYVENNELHIFSKSNGDKTVLIFTKKS